MPARIVEDLTSDSRQFLLNEFNSQHTFNFGPNYRQDEVVPLAQPIKPVKKLHVALFLIMCVMLWLIASFSATYAVPLVSLWRTAVVFEEPGIDGYVSRAVVVLHDLFGGPLPHDRKPFCPGHDIATTPMYRLNAFPLVLETDAKVNLWVLLLFVVLVTGALELYRSNFYWQYTYDEGPDIARWLEYAITSPLQVLVVAIAFHIRDVAHLSTLGALQAALVIAGFSIEREIQLIGNSVSSSLLPVCVIFAVSLVGHIIIWVTIRQQSDLENKMALDCTYKYSPDRQTFDDMSTVLDGIYYAEALLFSCFILVPVYTLKMTLNAGVDQNKVWQRTAQAYSILSVFAKSALIVGFVFYARSFGGTTPADNRLNVTYSYNIEPIDVFLNIVNTTATPSTVNTTASPSNTTVTNVRR